MLLPFRIPTATRSNNDGWSTGNIFKRAAGNSADTTLMTVGIVTAVIVLLLICFIVWRRLKKSKNGAFSKKKRGGYLQTNNADDSTATTRQTAANSDTTASETSRNRNSTATTVDRNTSVRSVMTLPAYRHKPNEHEQVLGREGERDGVDVVVEMPTAEADEALRDDEMEALYQIRLARRTEIAEREERRRLRREARARGDMVALAELNERARAASSSSTVEELRSEHSRIKQNRQRAVSSVSYADLGVARLDGTRIRNSMESETVGLLSDAASISNSLSAHRRDRSASSVISFDSNQDFPSPGLPPSGAATPRRISAQHTGGTATAGSSPEIIGEADLGDSTMPPHEPPGYEDVSLEDARSGTTTPNFPDMPPDYATWDQNDPRLRDAVNAANALNRANSNGDLSSAEGEVERRSSRGSTRTVPRLPSLRMSELPQIVVQPSSAYPRDRSPY